MPFDGHAGTYPVRPRATVDGRGEDVPLPLAEDGRYSISGGKLPVTPEAAGGRIRFAESRYPDHICRHTGWLPQEYDPAVCMPAGVVVTMEPKPEILSPLNFFAADVSAHLRLSCANGILYIREMA